MGQFAGTTFGIGTPTIYPPNPWGFSPYGSQGLGPQTFLPQPYAQTLSNPLIGSGYGTGTMPLLQQIAQLLQIVPQQLQQVQFLQYQQLLHLQQLLQIVPAQLQHLIQVTPSQGQQLQQQWQPFGAGVSGALGVGLVPQPFAGQATGQVM